MARTKRPKLEVGDVFSIPLDDDRVGYGQIVARYGRSGTHFYFAVFDADDEADSEPDVDVIVSRPLVLLRCRWMRCSFMATGE